MGIYYSKLRETLDRCEIIKSLSSDLLNLAEIHDIDDSLLYLECGGTRVLVPSSVTKSVISKAGAELAKRLEKEMNEFKNIDIHKPSEEDTNEEEQ